MLYEEDTFQFLTQALLKPNPTFTYYIVKSRNVYGCTVSDTILITVNMTVRDNSGFLFKFVRMQVFE